MIRQIVIHFYKKYDVKIVGIVLLVLGSIAALHNALGSALLLLVCLGFGTLWALSKIGFREKELFFLFCVALCVYLLVAAGIYYAHFYPFGGGDIDERVNNLAAVMISNDFRHGNFSLESLEQHLTGPIRIYWYPLVIGVFYTFFAQDEIVGKMVSIWFAGLSVILLYLLAKEFGASSKWAFFTGLVGALLPAFLYFGSLILKESMVTALFLLVLLFIVKLIKQFSWPTFLVAYVALGLLVSLRFYVGFAALYSFVLILPWLGIPNWKTKLRFATAIFLMLGFLPQLFGYGYYGISYAKNFLGVKQITAYRQFAGDSIIRSSSQIQTTAQTAYDEGSTIIVRGDIKNPIAFIKSYLVSFVYVLLGPFPWQIRYARQVFALGESIPWLFAFFFIVKGAIHERRNYRLILPVLLASIGLIAAIALLINNYGTFMRIRIPAFLALLSLLPFAFSSFGGFFAGRQKDAKKIALE